MFETTTEQGLHAFDIFDAHKDLLTGAAMLVFYERYRSHHPRPHAVWRGHAITKIGIRGDLVDHKIEQMPRSVALELIAMTRSLRKEHPALERWGDLTPTLQRRLVESRVLPLEFKSIAKMNRLDVETDGDFLLVMAPAHVMGLLS